MGALGFLSSFGVALIFVLALDKIGPNNIYHHYETSKKEYVIHHGKNTFCCTCDLYVEPNLTSKFSIEKYRAIYSIPDTDVLFGPAHLYQGGVVTVSEQVIYIN